MATKCGSSTKVHCFRVKWPWHILTIASISLSPSSSCCHSSFYCCFKVGAPFHALASHSLQIQCFVPHSIKRMLFKQLHSYLFHYILHLSPSSVIYMTSFFIFLFDAWRHVSLAFVFCCLHLRQEIRWCFSSVEGFTSSCMLSIMHSQTCLSLSH